MKRRIGFLFILFVFFLLGFSFIKAKASGNDITMLDGASIRTEGTQGLKFSAEFAEEYLEYERGFFVIYGEATVSDLEAAIAADDLTINGKLAKRVSNYDKTTETIHVVLTGIPEVGYGHEITVVGFAYDEGTYTFVQTVVTRSIMDVARAIYNTQPEEYEDDLKTAIDNIVETRRIKVTSTTGISSYYESFADLNLTNGDTIELTRGEFLGALTIDKSNITVLGTNVDKPINNSGVREAGSLEESIFKDNYIVVEDGVNNLQINGLNFQNVRGAHFNGTHKNIDIRYCLFNVSGNWIIRDQGENCDIKNILITKNYFKSRAKSHSRDIFFQGLVKNISVIDNYFENNLSELSGDDYGVRLMKLNDNSIVDIYNNTFNKLGSSYIIDIGYYQLTGDDAPKNCMVNIEDNLIVPHYLTCLGGNAIRVMNIGENTQISILRNSIRTSPYFNAILISTASAANSALEVSGISVEIIHNKFYAEDLALVTKPEDRNVVTSRFTRIGLGIPTTASMIYDNNYFGSSTSRAAYTTNTNAGAYNGTNQTVITTNRADDSDAANNGYISLLADFNTKVTTYLDEAGELASDVNAFFGGSGDLDILDYIPSFDSEDAEVFEIQNGKLVYTDTKLYLYRIANLLGVEAATSQWGGL